MKKEVKIMTEENFRPYGTFISWEKIDVKNDPVNFYKEDSIVSKLSTDLCAVTLQGVSPRDFVVDRSEYHLNTEEIYGGFEEDVVMHIGSPSESPKAADIELFLLPANCYCRIKRGVWHMAPFALGQNRIHGIVILPPYTYTHDCFVKPLDEPITFDPAEIKK